MVETIISLSLTGVAILLGLVSACFPKTDSPKPTEMPGEENPPITQPVPGGTTTTGTTTTGTTTTGTTTTGTTTTGTTTTGTTTTGTTTTGTTTTGTTTTGTTTTGTTPSKPYTPPPRVVPEEEKFLMGLLPVLYSGDKAAIRKNLYIEGLEDNFIDLIIDNMNYSQTAEEYGGYASAKVNKCESDTLDGKEMYRFDTTVTFKDGATCKEIFKIVKDSSGFKLTD